MRPALGRSRHRDLFGADLRAVGETPEARRARAGQRRRRSGLLGAGERCGSGQRDDAAQIQWRNDMASAYQAARQGAAFIDRSGRGRLVVSGRDRASYLQGLLTNDIPAVKAGEGCYAAYLTAQGRMIADLWVYELGDVILLSLAGDLRRRCWRRLDQFIFSEDVQLGDVSEDVRAGRRRRPGRRAGGGSVARRCPGRSAGVAARTRQPAQPHSPGAPPSSRA